MKLHENNHKITFYSLNSNETIIYNKLIIHYSMHNGHNDMNRNYNMKLKAL